MMKKKKRFLNNDNNLLTLLMQMAKIMFTGIIAKSTLHLYRNKIDLVVVSEHYLLRTCRSFFSCFIHRHVVMVVNLHNGHLPSE